MSNKIILKKSSVVNRTPSTSDLDYGELALNYADGKLHYKKSDGSTISNFPSAEVVSAGYVAKAGSTMTGTLNLPSNGLTVGTTQLVVSGGNVLIGASIDNEIDKLQVNGSIAGTALISTASAGDEGGEIRLNKSVTNTTLTTGVTIDVYQNKLRIFETGGTNRGLYFDLSAAGASVSTNGLAGGAGTVTSVSGTGSVSGLTLTGTVTDSGSLTLGGTLSLTSENVTTALGFTPYNATNPNGYITSSGTATNVSGTVAIANGGTGATTAAAALTNLGAYAASNPSGYTTNTGTVTSIATNNGITGGTITTTGTLGLTGQALALHNLSTSGIVARTGADTFAGRTLTADTGISISNGDGVSGNPTITNTDLGSSQNIFKNIAVAGQTTVVADNNNDTITLVAGTNITITTDAATDSITINANDASVALGTDTTGNYVATITGTSNQVNVSGSGSETADVTLSLPQDIHTGASPTFAGATLDAIRVGITAANEIDTTSGNLVLDSSSGLTIVDDNLEVTGNITIDGNLTVSGTTTTLTATNLAVSDNMLYMNQAIQTTITNAVGNGSTVVYTTAEDHNYLVGYSVSITGVTPSAYSLSNQTITAVTSNSFTVNNTATGTYVSGGIGRGRSNSNPDLGIAFGYYDGTYQHGGFFRDATDTYFKVFKGYTPEPDSSAFIDTSHASFALADIQAANFRGALVGNASTATTLAVARTINGVSFNGSTNIIVADDTKQPLDADLTAIAALTGTSGFLKKTAADTWSLDTNVGTVTSVSGTAPVVSSGGTTPTISMAAASSGVDGYMTGTYATKLDGIAAGATNVTNTNQLTNGAGFITSSSLSSYLPLTGGALTGALTIGGSVAAPADSTATALSYGRLQGYGHIHINADTDQSTSEFVYITAGYATANSSSANGLAVGNTTLTWKDNAVLHAGNYTSYRPPLLQPINATSTSVSNWNPQGLTYQAWGQAFFNSNISGDSGDITFWLRPTSPTGGTELCVMIDGDYFAGTGQHKVLHAGNYNSYSPTLTGTGASGTWGIDITGNAATATTANQIDGIGFRNTGSNDAVNADTIESNGITYYASGVTNFSGNATDGALYSQAYSSSWQHQIAGDYRSGQIALRGKNSGTWQAWRTVLDSSNYTSYAAASDHNHTYNVNDAWLRDNGDNANVKLYGNSRQMAFRTDGTTEYASGVGGYPFAWMYGGDGAEHRLMLLNTSGDLWTSTNGWLSTALAGKQNSGSYLTSESDTLATVTGRGASTSTLCNFNGNMTISGGTPTITHAGFAGIEYYNNSTWQVFIGTENNTSGARYNSRLGVHTWYSNGTQTAQLNGNNLTIVGSLSAASKSFLIPHPTKPGMKLRYGSLEGPENGVYIRGKLKGKNKIELPEYWTKLVDPDSITVTLTPIGKHQKLYVEDIADNVVTVANDGFFAGEINCFFVVYGERVDIDKLVVESE
jgi:hypothetical protein